jgi:hypothetical protein
MQIDDCSNILKYNIAVATTRKLINKGWERGQIEKFLTSPLPSRNCSLGEGAGG